MEFTATTKGPNLDRLTADAAKALRGEQRKLGREIAKAGRRAVVADVRARRSGGTRFSGMNTRLGASTKVTPGAQLTVTITAKPPGPWSIIEQGARGHDIYPKKGRQGRGGRPAALHFAGLYSAHAWHPGVAARPIWWSTENALDAAVTPVIEDAFDDAMEGFD